MELTTLVGPHERLGDRRRDPLVLETAVVASSACDLFLAIGTSLSVQPAASLAVEAHRRGARLVIVNQGETPLDDRADAIAKAQAQMGGGQ